MKRTPGACALQPNREVVGPAPFVEDEHPGRVTARYVSEHVDITPRQRRARDHEVDIAAIRSQVLCNWWAGMTRHANEA